MLGPSWPYTTPLLEETAASINTSK